MKISRSSVLLALGVTSVLLTAANASAETIVITKSPGPNFRPGPLHVTPYPVYYDPRHDEGKYDYWQRERFNELTARADHERRVFIARNGYEPPAGYIYYPYPPQTIRH